MESGPVETYPVHDYLRSKLCTLYENDSIFDKFEVDWSGDDKWVAVPYLFKTLYFLKFFKTFLDLHLFFHCQFLRIFNLVAILLIFSHILTGSYNNFFRSFKRGVEAGVAKTYEVKCDNPLYRRKSVWCYSTVWLKF